LVGAGGALPRLATQLDIAGVAAERVKLAPRVLLRQGCTVWD